MANNYEQEIISLLAEDYFKEEPIIVKGGTYPPTPFKAGDTDEPSIEIQLSKLFNNGWSWFVFGSCYRVCSCAKRRSQ